MAWIELHQTVWTHRKTIALACLLDVRETYAASHVIRLWTWALDNAPDGDLAKLHDRIIARGADWDGDPAAFVAALADAEFIDQDHRLHDWSDYAGRLLERRRQDAERKRLSRGCPPDVRRTSTAKSQRSTRTSTGRGADVRRNRTVPNQYTTGGSIPPEPPANDQPLPWDDTSTEAPDDTPLVDESPVERRLFDYYKARIFPTARTFSAAKIKTRLKAFSEDELRRGIDNFAADWWSMDKNSKRGADWFFANDARSEQYLHMTPRTREQAQTNNRRPTPIRPNMPHPQPPETDEQRKRREAQEAEALARADAIDAIMARDGVGLVEAFERFHAERAIS